MPVSYLQRAFTQFEGWEKQARHLRLDIGIALRARRRQTYLRSVSLTETDTHAITSSHLRTRIRPLHLSVCANILRRRKNGIGGEQTGRKRAVIVVPISEGVLEASLARHQSSARRRSTTYCA